MRSPLFFALLLSAALTSTLACGGSQKAHEGTTPTSQTAPAATATPTTPTAAVVPPGQAKVGDTTTCIVTGEEFVVTADSPKAEYDGQTYYMCCPGCVQRFKADPAKFVHKSDAAVTPAPAPTPAQ